MTSLLEETVVLFKRTDRAAMVVWVTENIFFVLWVFVVRFFFVCVCVATFVPKNGFASFKDI